jgi:peptide-methionine (S)-S-oxide reductase
MEIATFAAGCFWHVEETFRLLPGVIATEVGYMGGTTEQPSYEQVCSQLTGHAEVVRVTFDPEQITYDDLLQQFWLCHDPTQLNRQGPDFGTNYRSAIFCHSDGQMAAARASLRAEEENGRHRARIVTHIEPAGIFWRAEEYHQHYLAKKGGAGCRL